MKARDYTVLSRAIEIGIEQGYNNAYKYNDDPKEQEFINALEEASLMEISDVFDFDEGSNLVNL